MNKSFPKFLLSLLVWNVLALLPAKASHSFVSPHTTVNPVTEAPVECNIFDVVATALPCNNNGTFMVAISFGFNDTGQQGYRIQGNGQIYGTFSYNEPFPVLGPFQAGAQNQWEFVVVDLATPNCAATAFVGPVNCNTLACSLFDLEASLSPCTGGGIHTLTVNFGYANVQNVGFDLFLDNEHFGFYQYSQLPLTIDNLQLNPDHEHLVVRVCENDNGDCCATTEINIPACNTDPEGDCLNFEEYLGESYGGPQGDQTGTTIFTDQDVSVVLIPFQNIDWTTLFGELHIVPADNFPGFTAADGAVVTYSGINTAFNLTQYPNDIHSITVNFLGNIGPFNFAANGAPPLVLFTLTNGVYNIGPGVEMTVERNPNHPEEGTITFTGNIYSLLIGGLHLVIDNFCIHPEVPPCNISAVHVEATDCNDNNEFYVILTADYANTSDSFALRLNGDLYGHFAFADLPLELGPFDGPTDHGWLFKMFDLEHPDCVKGAELPIVHCGPECHLGNDGATHEIVCHNDQNTYDITFNFPYQGVSDSFTLNTLGGLHGTFAYADLPITLTNVPIPSNVAHHDRLFICDQQSANCCLEISYDLPCTPIVCTISSVHVEATDCNDNNEFFVILNAEYDNASDSFALRLNGDLYGHFAFADLPLELGPFDGPTTHGWLFKVIDLEHPDCMKAAELPIVHCGPECHLGGDGFDYSYECHNDQNTYDITFTFTYQVVSDSFRLNTLGGFQGTFAYADLPITLTGLTIPANNTHHDRLFICDQESPNCCIEISYNLSCTPPVCNISAVLLDATDCNDNNQFFVTVNAEFDNVSDSFALRVNGDLYGHYAFADLPLQIGPFNGNANHGWVFKVIDLEHPDCMRAAELPIINCNPDCHIGSDGLDWTVECHNNLTTYDITFDLNYQAGSDSFTLNTLGGFHGTFAYADLPITLSNLPIPTNSQHHDRLFICDLESPNCCHERGYDLPCIPTCTIGDLHLEVLPCDDGGMFSVVLNFQHNTPSDQFSLYIDGNLYEIFSYNDLPLTIGPFAGDGTHGHHFLVRDASGLCAEDRNLEPVICTDDCIISNIVAERHACENGQYLVDVAFTDHNGGSLGYLIFANGQIYGPFDYNLPFVTIGPFPGDGQTDVDILILDVENPFCYGYRSLDAYTCQNNADCHMGDLVVTPQPCTPNGIYYVQINFAHSNTSQHFVVMGNGINYGTFSYEDLPITVGPFNGNGDATYELGVRDAEHPDCHTSANFGPIDCTPGNPGEVWPGDTDNDNIARHFDLLKIGVGFNTQGPARNSTSITWEGMPATDWPDFFEDDVNHKYADCNGNGVINQGDKEAIVQNYGLTHGVVAPYTPILATPNDPPIFVDLSNIGTLSNGAHLEAPVRLGTDNHPVEAIYGLAFTLEYDPQVIDPTTVEVNFPTNSWFAQPNTNNALAITKSYPAEGIVEVAITRINHLNIGGSGPIALFRGVIDDIAGLSQSEILVTQIKAIRANESSVPLYNPVMPLQLTDNNNDPGRVEMLRSIKLFPNPTSDLVYIHNKYMIPVSSVRILDTKGQMVAQPTVENNVVSIGNLQSGMYIMEVHIHNYIFHLKVVKI